MNESEESANLLEVKNLSKYFPLRGGLLTQVVAQLKAVDGVSFLVKKGETLGIVGESGCGKSTMGRTILRLLEPTGGEVFFEGRDIFKISKREFRQKRQEMQIIFQDPYGSLNPRMTVGKIIGEPLKHAGVPARVAAARVRELVDTVGLDAGHLSKYPHEFSGGQRQRIGIARALALQPKFIVCDEPVSALDVSIQSQIINLLDDLQEKFSLTYLFISHGLAVVRHISHRVAVMYLGKIVEMAAVDELFSHPGHPYTKALLSAIPVPDPAARKERIILTGDVPSPIDVPERCRFYSRCPQKTDECREKEPALLPVSDGHFVSCYLIR